jgi:hypothetical protein
VDDDNSGSPPIFGPITFLVLLSYLLCKRALDNEKKEFEPSQENISSSSNVESSLDASSFVSGLGNTSSFFVDVQPMLNSFEDFVGNESVHVASSDIAPILEIALSAFPPPATVEFWEVDTARRIPVARYEPMPASRNVLLLHDVSTCPADDKPTPSTVSSLLRIVEVLYTLFTVFLCGIVIYLLTYVTFSGSNDAAPEDMDDAEASFVSPTSRIFLTPPLLNSSFASDPSTTLRRFLRTSDLLSSSWISPM